ncbi:putative serine/threonine-protein kinase PkwA [Dyadobacter sp. CECT 9275]|uniref:Serine/threonine-protein kinase PkwA n=1 Tax=Dyadobacter helix TaxID=2822344 RepID=A0A916J942_9BACT|nr:cytochrome D1 domain-containing protein [Dyadobacter sp. CECT 9275]CAG4991221.1 putative serine/threonine-protein kinase PkwA [Dyadobacter sp. CECT 9275]
MNIRKIDTFSGHRDSVYTVVPDRSEHGFYSAGGDGYVIRWNLTRPDLGDLVARAGVSVYSLCYDPTNASLWIGQNYEGIQILDTINNRIEKTSKITAAAIFDIQISGTKAFIALGDGVILVMDIPTLSVQKHIKVSNKSIRSIAIHPMGSEFAVGDSESNIHLFDSDGFQLKKTLMAHSNSVFTVCYSPDGRYLLTSGRDAYLKVWDVSDHYQQIMDIPAHMYAINHITYSPDTRFFATASMDKSIKIWDAETFRLKKIIDRARHAGHGTSVNKLLWTSYENQLVSCSDDRMISVWEVDR